MADTRNNPFMSTIESFRSAPDPGRGTAGLKDPRGPATRAIGGRPDTSSGGRLERELWTAAASIYSGKDGMADQANALDKSTSTSYDGGAIENSLRGAGVSKTERDQYRYDGGASLHKSEGDQFQYDSGGNTIHGSNGGTTAYGDDTPPDPEPKKMDKPKDKASTLKDQAQKSAGESSDSINELNPTFMGPPKSAMNPAEKANQDQQQASTNGAIRIQIAKLVLHGDGGADLESNGTGAATGG